MLTVDEIAFVGGKIGIDNSNYYINKNAAVNVWWVISPSFYVSDFDSFFNVLNTGLLCENNIINDVVSRFETVFTQKMQSSTETRNNILNALAEMRNISNDYSMLYFQLGGSK